MKKITLIILIILYAIIQGQTSPQTLQLPTIVPPSPTAQNFMRYGEIPVDYSTGVPKIQIPIYTVKGKNLELPIYVSYHASGIKVSDVSSEVGIGWVLNAGGIVSRTMLDVVDESGASNKTYSSANQFLNAVPNIIYGSVSNSCNCYPGSSSLEMYLDSKCNNEDLMSDRYFYTLPNGISGVFRYNYPQNNTLITLPYRPYKINKTIVTSASNGNFITEFRITDDKGILYVYQRFQDSSYGSSEWFLKEITSADGSEHITLNYIPQQSVSNGRPINTLYTPKEFMNGVNCNPAAAESFPSDQGGGTGGGTYSVVLSSIENDQDLITFTYSDREDFQYLKKISEIKIASKKDPATIKKKVTFNQSYFGTVGYGNSETMNKRLKLNSLNIYGENNPTPQTYTFTYEESVMLPPYLSRAVDFWGYYNGSSNGTAIPENMLPANYQGHGYGGNRQADNGSFSKACTLKEIKYPTGGKTKFDFERCNVGGLFNGPSSGGYIGGLRVSKITNYSKENEIANIKSYQYSDPQFNPIDSEFYSYNQNYIDYYEVPSPVPYQATNYCWVFYKRNIINSSPVVSHDLAPGLPLAYPNVKEYDGTLSDNAGYIEYHYSTPNLVSYPNPLRELHTFQEDRGNYEPKLISKITKSKNGTLVSEENNFYSDYFEQEFTTGINITRTLDYLPRFRNIDLPTYATTPYGQTAPYSTNDYIQALKAHDTKAYQKATLLDYSIKRTYDRLDTSKYVEERVDYQKYNQHNLMVKEMSTITSLGDSIKTNYKYPFDFGTQEPYQTMLSKNILTPIIEQTISNTTANKQIQKIHTDYKNWGSNIIEPEVVKVQTSIELPLEDRVRFLSYDQKGNVTSVKKESGSPISYLWGYNNTLPIAMVENCKLISEAGTESQNKTISNNLYIPMGNTVYELGTFTITEEKNYKVERTYQKTPEDKSVMYQIQFENINNNNNSVFFTDNTPSVGSTYTFTTQAQLLKPGTYKVKLINIGYNGYQGSMEHNFYFTIYNMANITKTVPFHTSFEEDTENVNMVQSKTGNKSHVGQYYVKLPSASLGYDKVIVSYWGKSSDTSPWEYVENIVNLTGQNYNIGQAYYYIDEVRVYPVDAMMTTYTYDPFYQQQTSIMKPNGQTEYYNYDAFGRLKEVYMIEGNVKKILKANDYHYKP